MDWYIRPRPTVGETVTRELDLTRAALAHRFDERGDVATLLDRAEYVGHSINNIRLRHGDEAAEAFAEALRDEGEEIVEIVTRPIVPLIVFG